MKKRPKITQVKSLKYYFCTVRSFPRTINQKPNISQKQDLKDASPPTVDQFKRQKWSQWKGNREKSKRYENYIKNGLKIIGHGSHGVINTNVKFMVQINTDVYRNIRRKVLQ